MSELKKSEVQVPSKVIPLNKAVSYYNNFYKTRLANETTNTTRAVWFEFEALQNYFKNVISFCADKKIEISRFAFLLGADENNSRTVFIAPVTYDEQLDLHRAFSFDNDKITFIHRFAGESYSTIEDFDQLQSLDQSLILFDSKAISSAKAISLYNNYHDTITQPFADVVAKDTRFVYYEKGEFEAYLSFLEEQSILHGIKISGLNVIFGAHDNTQQEGIYSNHLTLFFAPTNNGSSKSFSSFNLAKEYLLDFSKNTINFEPHSPILSTSSLFNDGHSGPPPFTWD